MAAEPTKPKSSQSIAAVERALDVLLLFVNTGSKDLGVTEISGELGLSKAAVHRILTSLRSRDLVNVDEDSRRYTLGPGALALGQAYLSRLDIRALGRPELEALSAATRETATMSLRSGTQRVYVAQVVPPREVRMEVPLGVPYPIHAGASSKAFLAFLPPTELEPLLTGSLPKVTPETVTDPVELRKELAEIRARGYALSLGERQAGAGSVAAPIRDADGYPVAVVSVSGPLDRFAEEVPQCTDLLLAAVKRLSSRMGYRG